LDGLLESYFVPEKILGEVRSGLAGDYRKKALKKYLKWLNSKTGKKVTELEIAATSPQAAVGIMVYAMKMQQTPPPESRATLAKRMIRVLGYEERLERRTGAIFSKIMTGINQALAVDRKLSGDQLEEINRIFIAQSSKQTKSALLPTVLFTYEALDDKEFERYVRFLESPEAAWFNDVIFNSQLDAFEADAARFGTAVAGEIAKLDIEKPEAVHWKTYRAGDRSFSLKFPGQPEENDTEIPTGDGSLTMHALTAEAGGVAVVFTWVNDYPPLLEQGYDTEEILTNASKGAAANVGGAVLDKKFLKHKAYDGIEFRVALMGGAGLIKSRVYVAGKRLYQAIITGPMVKVTSDKMNPFLDSIDIR